MFCIFVLFLDPDFWAEDFKQTLRKSPKGQEILRNMIKVARSVRDESLILSENYPMKSKAKF